jgi:hypothetical protein
MREKEGSLPFTVILTLGARSIPPASWAPLATRMVTMAAQKIKREE